MRFLGNIEAKTDAKGRVFLPAVFRKELQAFCEERLVLRKDIFQSCLVLYPESVWNQQIDILRQIWNAETANEPFMEPNAFGEALQQIMSRENNYDE